MNIDKMITPLKFWCYKIIPLVYDDSLSYLECLAKMRDKINEVIKNTNEIPEYIDQKIKEAFDDEHIRELISEIFRTIEDAISANNEGTNTNFESDYEIGTLLWHDNKLYRAKRHIDAGDTVIVDTNIELVNFADMFDAFITEIKTDFTDNDDGLRETSSMDRPIHDLVWLNNVLYEVIKPIAEGNAYIYSGANKNVEQTNLDKIYDYLLDLISSEIDAREAADDAEALARENADNALQNNIDGEATARQNADTALQNNIDAEATARQNADTALQNNIDAEATARQNADTALQNNIDAEAAARQLADANLLNKINTIFGSNVILVAKAGVQFNNITNAVNSIKNSVSSSNPYLILVASGTYNEHVDLTDINGLTIFGLGNVKIADTSTYPMSTIYVTGEVSLINLHLIQFGDSYCIHSDTQGTNSRVQLTVRNCILQRVQMGSGTYQHCIGWGSCDIGGDIYEIHNSHFIGGIGLGGHLNPFNTATGAVSWRVCNCTFEVATAMIDWGDPCMMIYGTPTAQTIAAVFIGNQSNMGVIYRVNTSEVYNYIKAGTFCSLILSKGNNVPALNGVGPVTQWFVGSFSQSNTLGMAFVPFANAQLYDLEITYAILQGNGTDIKASCSVFTQSPNGFTIQTNNYSAVGDYCVMIGTLATPKANTVF